MRSKGARRLTSASSTPPTSRVLDNRALTDTRPIILLTKPQARRWTYDRLEHADLPSSQFHRVVGRNSGPVDDQVRSGPERRPQSCSESTVQLAQPHCEEHQGCNAGLHSYKVCRTSHFTKTFVLLWADCSFLFALYDSNSLWLFI